MKKILLYKKNNLIGGSGGAESVICNMSNALSAMGYKVYIVTRDEKDGTVFFPLNNKVDFIKIAVRFSFFQRIVYRLFCLFGISGLIKYFDREYAISSAIKSVIDDIGPDVIISSGVPDTLDIMYKQKLDIPVVLMLHSTPDAYFKVGRKRLKTYVDTLKKVSVAQVLLPSFIEVLKKYYNGKTVVIGNAIKDHDYTKNHDEPDKKIVYVARIRKNKQQDMLIKAFGKIAKDYPKWQVELYGASKKQEYTDYCNDLIKTEKVENQVHFMGTTDNAFEVFAKADICAFPSKFEGFGLALVEAMSVGLPCVGLRSCCGVNELIEDSKNGYLVDDVEDFAQKLKILIDNKSLRKEMGNNAISTANGYKSEIIWQKWDALLKSL